MSRTLSEPESKALLASYGIPCVAERIVSDAGAAAAAASELGYPVVVKLAGGAITHKTERGLVRLDLATAEEVTAAATELLAAARPEDGDVSVLVAPMIRGIRELIVGVHRDPQFGACVMVGIGGVLAEAIADVAFRLAPISDIDAEEMIADLAGQALLGSVRGQAAADMTSLVGVLRALSRLADERDDVVSIDVNPLLLDMHGAPIALDALVETAA